MIQLEEKKYILKKVQVLSEKIERLLFIDDLHQDINGIKDYEIYRVDDAIEELDFMVNCMYNDAGNNKYKYYIVALEEGGLMEQPEIEYKCYDVIYSDSEESAKKEYNDKHKCNFFYGKVIGIIPLSSIADIINNSKNGHHCRIDLDIFCKSSSMSNDLNNKIIVLLKDQKLIKEGE